MFTHALIGATIVGSGFALGGVYEALKHPPDYIGASIAMCVVSLHCVLLAHVLHK